MKKVITSLCGPPPRLLAAPGNAAAGEVIGGHLHRYFVARQNPDEIHPELSGDMGQNLVPVSNVNLKRRVRQRFHDDAFHFDHIRLCQTLSLLFRPFGFLPQLVAHKAHRRRPRKLLQLRA